MAKYLCIEPWSSLPSRKNITEDLEQQDNLLSLSSDEIYNTRIFFEFT
jgi:galactose mutarotase-like enzyme